MTHAEHIYYPTVRQVSAARKALAEYEPRDLFYRVAIELIDLSRDGKTVITVPEALAVLLKTWNATYYRFHGRFTEGDFQKLDTTLKRHAGTIERYRGRSILSFGPTDAQVVKNAFRDFHSILGSVGASKALHLLARSFFPLWDRAIAKHYHLNPDRKVPEEYIKLMQIAKKQCAHLLDHGASWPDLLKALDEYNYCRFTLKVIKV